MEYTETVKLEITQDKLVDLLMHAATREDIASTRKDLKDDISSLRSELKDGMSSLKSEFKNDMSSLRSELKDEMSSLKSEFKNDMSSLRSELKDDVSSLKADMHILKNELTARMDKLDSKNDRIIWFVILSMLVPIFLHIFHI